MHVRRDFVFYMKVLLVVISVSTYVMPYKPYPYILSIINISLILINRRVKVAALALLNTLVLLALLSLASIVVGGGLYSAFNYSLYVLTSLTAILYIGISTKPSDIEKYLKIKGLVRFATLIYMLREEIIAVYETFKARGYVVSLNFMKVIPPLITILVNVIDRVLTLEESLKARGSEEI